MSAILELNQVRSGYTGDVEILQKVDMSLEEGKLTVLIGPNGAGKSTTLKTIFGFLPPWSGEIRFLGQRIDTLDPFEIKRLGISYIPQTINVFPQLTVEENLKLGGWIRRGEKAWLQNQLEKTYELFPILKDFRKRRANQLSGGQAKMLSIAKEVLSEPKLILVDEPTAALAPLIAQDTYEFLLTTQRALNAAIILVDHHMEKAAELADYVYVLSLGKMVEHGPGSEFDVERLKDIIRQCLLAE
ncbi:MAG: ABC transporter ATP-binding protein [Chloroflexi bacterium]|nr:ABC transporter ATP-binding protein [Chloroflexota bacterium]